MRHSASDLARRRHAATGSGSSNFLPNQLPNLAAWFRWNQGITVTGSGVSQWNDVTANARHLKQGTDTNRPAKQSDGSILFDGSDNFLKCDAFTLNQPETVLLLARQKTWTGLDRIFDGNTATTGMLRQVTVTPQVSVSAGSSLSNSSSWTLDTYAVLAVVFNGASSSFQVNNGTPITGDAGSNNMGGFTLGAAGGGGSAWSNIEVKEVIIYAAALNAANMLRSIKYLARLGSIAL